MSNHTSDYFKVSDIEDETNAQRIARLQTARTAFVVNSTAGINRAQAALNHGNAVAYASRRQDTVRKAKRAKVIAYVIAAQTLTVAAAVGVVITK